MNFPIEQLRLYVFTRHKTGTATKDIIDEMTQVVQDETWVSWHKTNTRVQNMAWQKKGAKKLRAVKPKLTPRKQC